MDARTSCTILLGTKFKVVVQDTLLFGTILLVWHIFLGALNVVFYCCKILEFLCELHIKISLSLASFPFRVFPGEFPKKSLCQT